VSARLICCAALLALAACGKSEEKAGKQTPEQVAKEMGSLKMRPGQWEATQEILSATAPGMPAEAMRQMVGNKTTVSSCVTPEQADKPSANFLAGQKNNNCTYEDFSMENGRMTGTMTCSGGGVPGKVVMKVAGDYSPLAYQMDMDMNIAAAPGMNMVVKARTVGRRTGECTETPK
jgi:Tfp pilus assembly protein PilP